MDFFYYIIKNSNLRCYAGNEIIYKEHRMYNRKSVKLLLICAAFIIFKAVSVSPLKAEFVFLKDGSIAEGRIISDAANSVTLRLGDKKTRQIPRSDIMRVLYTKFRMGKIYIQKRDGKGIVAFMVDEDQDTYTFRKDLYKPEEFVLKRMDVLFISEKNPSGLQVDGDIGTDRVSLLWLPPYDAVKRYNIYIKKNEKDKYEPAGSTGSKSITLKNLASNRDYYLIVTSVDSSDYESPPSNELKITTKNIPPDEPVIISIDKTGPEEIKIVWGESSDPDGKVVKYRLYGTKNGNREIISETTKTEYILKNAVSYDKVYLTAVDDMGDDSDAIKVQGNSLLSFYPGVIYPTGKFEDMYDMGYGGMVSYSMRNIFFDNFEGSLNTGFYFMKGKDRIEESNKDYQSLIFVPLYLSTSYNIGIGDSFSIKPVLSFGGAYLDAEYLNLNKTVSEGREVHLRIFEPSFKAGFTADYTITELYSISAGFEYGGIVEKNGMLGFMLFNIGIVYYF